MTCAAPFPVKHVFCRRSARFFLFALCVGCVASDNIVLLTGMGTACIRVGGTVAHRGIGLCEDAVDLYSSDEPFLYFASPHPWVRFRTHLYFRNLSITHGIFPTSSRQVQAYTRSTGQWNTKAPSIASGMASPHMQTARLYMSKIVYCLYILAVYYQ